MRLLLLLFFLHAVNFAFPQERTISLSKEKITSLYPRYRVVAVEDVRNKVDFREFVGIEKTLTGRRVLKTDFPLAIEVESFFKRSFAFDTVGRKSLLIRINKLFLQEKDGEGLLEVSMSFLEIKSRDTIPLATIAKVETHKSDGIFNYMPPNLIAKGLESCFQEFLLRDEQGMLCSEVFSTDSLIGFVDASIFPIYDIEKPKRGVYFSFRDFLENAPQSETGLKFSIRPIPALNNQLPFVHVRWRYPDSLKNKRVWGVSDGKKSYVLVMNRYFEIERHDNAFTFHGNLPKAYSVNIPVWVEATSWSGVLVGAIILGGVELLERGIEENLAYNNDGPNGHYRLNPATGDITTYTETSAFDETKENAIKATVIILADRLTKKTYKVIIDGKERCTLRRGEYLKMDFFPPNLSPAIEVEMDGEKKTIQPDLDYFALEIVQLRSKSKKPHVHLTKLDRKAYLMSEIEKGKYTELCAEK